MRLRKVGESTQNWLLQKVQEEWARSPLAMDQSATMNPISKKILTFRMGRLDISRMARQLSITLEIEDILAAIERLQPLPLPVPLRLLLPPLRLPEPRIEVLQPLTGRAPPSVAIFVPIPHKTEMGSCARSDLAVSAY